MKQRTEPCKSKVRNTARGRFHFTSAVSRSKVMYSTKITMILEAI